MRTKEPGLMRLIDHCLLLLAVLVAAFGCTGTSMLPASRIDAGETVTSVSIDEPGILIIPQVRAQLTRGVAGRGDVTVNVSGVPAEGIVLPGAGLTGRYYLAKGADAELQVEATGLGDGRGSSSPA